MQSISTFQFTNQTYIVEEKKDQSDNTFAFAVLNCNSLLITATPSSIAWWIAYLMDEKSPIFFYRCKNCPTIVQKDYFSYEWIPLKIIDGEVQLDDFWEVDYNA